MKKSEQDCQDLAEMGVQIVSLPCLEKRKALAAPEGILALGRVADERECHTVLTHEKWHFKLGAFYALGASYTDRMRTEAAVNRAALLELVPKETLASLLQRGLTVYEVADLLDVTEEQVWEAWHYYRDRDAAYCAPAGE